VKDASLIATYSGSSYPIYSVAWAPNGRFVVFDTEYRKMHLWDPFHPETERVTDLGAYATSLAFSPDGERLAATAGRKIVIFKVTAKTDN